jgi:sulfate/thiosulfate transport system substrate-binding protein
MEERIMTRSRIAIGIAVLIIALAMLSTGCPGNSGAKKPGETAPTGVNQGANTGQPSVAGTEIKILNVSYDPTRELYEEYNKVFSAYYKTKTGQNVTVTQSHGGSGGQARTVIEGNEADVVTLALAFDVDAIKKEGLINEGWQANLPNNSCPYTSTIVFLVRKGNPKGIKDWGDLVKKGVSVVTPNPKSSGGARWNFLAAWAYAMKQPGGDEAKALDFVTKLYKNVEVMDTGARGSTNTFSQKGIGDVLIAWENEAFLAIKELGADKFEMVVPSMSILAEPPVAVVDKNVDKHGTREAAKAYLEYLYTEEGQDIIAKHYYRPRSATVMAKYATQFPKITMVTIDGEFGGWDAAHAKFFADGGIFDQIYKPAAK